MTDTTYPSARAINAPANDWKYGENGLAPLSSNCGIYSATYLMICRWTPNNGSENMKRYEQVAHRYARWSRTGARTPRGGVLTSAARLATRASSLRAFVAVSKIFSKCEVMSTTLKCRLMVLPAKGHSNGVT